MTDTTPSGSWVYLDKIPHQARRLISVEGGDVHRFFQGTVSQDLDALQPGHAIAATLLTVKGKIVSELLLLCGEQKGSLRGVLVPVDSFDEVFASLDRHIIMDDVTLTPDARTGGKVGCVAWWGRTAPEPATDIDAYETTHPVQGKLYVGPPEALNAQFPRDRASSEVAWHQHRVAAGTPAWGHEIMADRFPPEVGFVSAVSYDKGCFMGQEPLARIHARGRTNWVMVRVKSSSDDQAPAVPVALHSQSRPDAGRWTSSAPGDEGGVVGLAIVHRSVAKPGTELDASGLLVTVISGPIGDDQTAL